MKKKFTFSYDYFPSIEGLNSDQRRAVEAAEKACAKAYAPYSNFKVGASLLLNDDTLVLGNNQENKAYPSGLCAERIALFSYGAQQKEQGIKILAVVGVGEMLNLNDYFSPCGACRQVMTEYAAMQDCPFEIIIKNWDGSLSVFEGVHHLLPFVFGGK